MDDPSLMPVRPKAEPRAEAPPLSAEEARRAALWLRWHFRAAAGLVAISAVVLLLVLGDYGGPFWAAVGLTLIGATLAFIGTMAMASRLSDAAARTGALTGAGLIGATCAGYIYLVTVGTLNLELGSLPLHTLALFLLGGLGSLAVYGFAVARLTGSARARRPALATVGAASVIAAILGAAMVGLIPNSEGLALSLLAPLGTHLTTVRDAPLARRLRERTGPGLRVADRSLSSRRSPAPSPRGSLRRARPSGTRDSGAPTTALSPWA